MVFTEVYQKYNNLNSHFECFEYRQCITTLHISNLLKDKTNRVFQRTYKCETTLPDSGYTMRTFIIFNTNIKAIFKFHGYMLHKENELWLLRK